MRDFSKWVSPVSPSQAEQKGHRGKPAFLDTLKLQNSVNTQVYSWLDNPLNLSSLSSQ